MAKLGISARSRHKFQVTTDSKQAWPIAEHHLDRAFTTVEPDRVWVADMTYNLDGANLTNADLLGANLTRTDLSTARLCNTRLANGDIHNEHCGGG